MGFSRPQQQMTRESSVDRAAGCLLGLALGDALGAVTEFLTIAEIRERFPPTGPTEPLGDPALVTDDTQMALAVGEALLAVTPPYTATMLEGPLRRHFVAWLESPDNTRAPGMTCLEACENLARGWAWQQATIPTSKGCGATMRVAPVGLLALAHPPVLPQTRAALAQFQAALTHGHPAALAAADLTAAVVADLALGGDPAGVVGRMWTYIETQQAVYHADWLGPLWQRPGVQTPEAFMAQGWEACQTVLHRLEAALQRPDPTADPCLATGAGWVAEEALATGLLCFLLSPDDPVAALRRAAASSGDSDSIAALTGAFAGAHHGLAAWPSAWYERIEYHDRLMALAEGLGAAPRRGGLVDPEG